MNFKNLWNKRGELWRDVVAFTCLVAKIIYRQVFYIPISTALIGGWWQCGREVQKKSKKHMIDSFSCEKNMSLLQTDCCNYPKSTDEKVNFSLTNSFIVLTDIIDSTRLYNEDPIMMRHCMALHYEMIITMLRKHRGHVVSNEGDSFHIAFQSASAAIDFCKNFIEAHDKTIQFFQIRLGIVKGKLNVRKLSGYKVFGKAIDEALGFFQHNDGTKICMKRSFVEKYSFKGDERYCVH